MDVPRHPVHVIGTRHGEKLFEVLLSREEVVAAKDLGRYYCISPDLRDLNYGKYMEQGEVKISEAVEYTSHNAAQLDIDGMKALLTKQNLMQATTRGKYNEPGEH